VHIIHYSKTETEKARRKRTKTENWETSIENPRCSGWNLKTDYEKFGCSFFLANLVLLDK
jgi:hypothetical protein